MAVVRRDGHGLYVRTGGWYVRPEVSAYAGHLAGLGYYGRLALPSAGASRYREGDRVDARPIPQTPLARVGEECWSLHGYQRSQTNSDAWNPA